MNSRTSGVRQNECEFRNPLGSMTVRIVTLTYSLLENFFYGGVIMGWALLVYVFKRDGIFSSVCEQEGQASPMSTYNVSTLSNTSEDSGVSSWPAELPLSCSAQDVQLSRVFTIGAVLVGFAGFPFGIFFDRFGLRASKTLASGLQMTGLLIIAFVTSETSYLLFLAIPLMFIMLPMYTILASHVALLAGSRSGTFVTLYAGAINCAVVTPLIVKLLYDSGIGRVYSVGALALIYLTSLVHTWCVLPKYKVGTPERKDYNSKTTDLNKNGQIKVSDGDCDVGKEEDCGKLMETGVGKSDSSLGTDDDDDTASLRSCLLSSACILHIFWFSVLHLRNIMFVVTFNSWVTNIVDADIEKVSFFTNLFGYLQIVLQVFCPLPGAMLDYSIRRLPAGISGFSRSRAIVPAVVLCCSFSLLISAAILLPGHSAIYISMILNEITRSFFYGVAAAYIQLTFPPLHYGKICGLMYLVSGIVALLQFPLFQWTRTGIHIVPVTILFLFLSASTFIHPISIWWRCSRRARSS